VKSKTRKAGEQVLVLGALAVMVGAAFPELGVLFIVVALVIVLPAVVLGAIFKGAPIGKGYPDGDGR
jgi:uncharacterized membrane protein